MIEQQAGVNYVTFVSLFHELIPSSNVSDGIKKATLDGLCKLASTESDQKLITYIHTYIHTYMLIASS